MFAIIKGMKSFIKIQLKQFSFPFNSKSYYTQMSLVMRKPTFWFLTWSNTNQAVQLQKMARGLKFRI